MIDITHLVKQFGTFTAVNDISLQVQPGEVLGFLGPNGAGKTTTMRIAAGFVTPTSGGVSICGIDMLESPNLAKTKIGYLPEGAPSYPDMRVADFLDFVASVRGYDKVTRKQKITAVVDKVDLGSVLHKTVETLSKGYKRRVGLAQAILHDPDVLIMDEPTDGLDPNQKQHVRDLIQQMSPKKAIIVSTHILEEVEAVCSRALIINQGRIVADGTPEQLLARSRYHGAVTLSLRGIDPANAKSRLEALDPVASVEQVKASEGVATFMAFPKTGAQLIDAVTLLVRHEGWDVDALVVERGRLDEVFRNVTKGEAA